MDISNAIVISEQGLYNAVSEGVKGNTFVTIQTASVPQMRKTGNPFFDKIRKLQTLNGMIGWNYQGWLDRTAEAEGKEERQAKPRSWGVVSPCKRFVFHKGQVYLRFRSERCLETPVYMIKNDDGINGTEAEISVDLLRQFLPVKAKSSTQADLDGEIFERDFSMSSINYIAFGGNVYMVTHDQPAIAPETQTIPITETVTVV